MAQLPCPRPLNINDTGKAAENWKIFAHAWKNYRLALELDKKDESVQVATLLTVIGEDAREVYGTFSWDTAGDDTKHTKVLEKFSEYCEPRKNVPYERYKFNQRGQEPGESYDRYRTALKKLAEGCDFGNINAEEVMRDRLVFGIRDSRVRERLLREDKLTLKRTDELCHAAESVSTQMSSITPAEVHQAAASSFSARSSNKGAQKTLTSQFGRRECRNCGRSHEFHRRELCPAYGKTCHHCSKQNHFAAQCRSTPSSQAPNQKRGPRGVNALGEMEELDEVGALHVYTTGPPSQLDDTQLITFKFPASGRCIRFQPDTGAQCNVLPVDIYKEATGDINLQKVSPTRTRLVAYGGSGIPILGSTELTVSRSGQTHVIKCQIIKHALRPLLGRKDCLRIGIIRYLDSDALKGRQFPDGNINVCSLEGKTPLSEEDLKQKFPAVFGTTPGEMPGEYRIRLDPDAQPTQHSPRRVPVALREKVQKKLEELANLGIIEKVTTPTPWISSMVEVMKGEKLRICLDPRDLNKSIQRENYTMPTIEEIATRLHGAKVFSKLDVRNGFWHVKLDEESSFLTTFHTPFGRYRWKRMPFGISSAPEVFQRRMHEHIEGLEGVEVIADDFIVVGFGDSLEEAIRDHDKHLLDFLWRCEEKNVVLNAEKLRLREEEVPFIGHIATARGLAADPKKIRAIAEMPAPTDRAGVQRLLGLAQYLTKFLPKLSDLIKPLRDLTKKDIAWSWDCPQQDAFRKLKQAVASTPVLKYYDVKAEVTLECDASQSGLGAAMKQNGQPVAYASRALTPTEQNYAQIEKELLAIVFACERFTEYIYGKAQVNVQTDHKPLESIVLKPLCQAPKRLQRMLLRLQKFDLKVKYCKGSELHLADTLSRAYLPEVCVCETSSEFELVDQRCDLAISNQRWCQLDKEAKDDAVQNDLREVIRTGWPQKKADLSMSLKPYFDVRHELTVQGNIVFKGHQVLVPFSLRRELLEVTHATHIGMEGCLRRARESLYWPGMSSEIKDFVAKCDVCQSYQQKQVKEPLLQHDLTSKAWEKLGIDLASIDSRNLLVVVDYYSNYIEVARVATTTSRSIIRELQIIFARFGIPRIVMTDNGPQFASAEFAAFAKSWGFVHQTSSPGYPQSNGKAENAVKTVKRLFTKCKASGQSEALALLDWRNTPTEGFTTSPAQRLFGHRCRTLLPIAEKLLEPTVTSQEDQLALRSQKARQEYHYNKSSKPLKPLAVGDTVRMRRPGQTTWSKGMCIAENPSGPRSYDIAIDDAIYRRNRHDIRTVPKEEPAAADFNDIEVPEEQDQTKDEEEEPDVNPEEPTETRVTRPSRKKSKPAWMNDYVLYK